MITSLPDETSSMVIGLVNIYPAPLDSGAVVPVEDQWEGGGASTAHAHAGCRGDTQEQHRGGHSGENQTQCPLFPSHSPPHLPMVSSRLCVPLTPPLTSLQSYNLMSERWFTHASPTLFNAGTCRPQLSSCFLICMKDDSIEVRGQNNYEGAPLIRAVIIS